MTRLLFEKQVTWLEAEAARSQAVMEDPNQPEARRRQARMRYEVTSQQAAAARDALAGKRVFALIGGRLPPVDHPST